MNLNDNLESPLLLNIGFKKLIEQYIPLLNSDDDIIKSKAEKVMAIKENYPELVKGFSETEKVQKYNDQIAFLLDDAFCPVLTNNEIKTASVPLHDYIFNSSQRFKKIITTAGEDFELKIMNMPEDDVYIIACTIILKFCYNYDLSWKRPFFYKIPDANGIMRYYKILYNADFTEITPNDNAIALEQSDIDELLDNYDNVEIWKKKFPPRSYTFNGFVISNIFDVTDDQSISNIKSNLIAEGKRQDKKFMKDFHNVFRSLFNVRKMKVGFSVYNKENKTFERVYGQGMKSYLLHNEDESPCDITLCKYSYNRLLNENKIYSVADIDAVYEKTKGKVRHIRSFKKQGIKSMIMAPIANDKELLGILELVSNEPKALNSVNATKLIDVMPFIVAAVERSKKEEENLIEAIIQQECTSIHPSVYWKFKHSASKFIKNNILQDLNTPFDKIAFESVYPLFGQIDVKASSNARNLATQKDLALQLSLAEKIMGEALENQYLPVFEQIQFQIHNYLDELKEEFKVDSEHQITSFLKDELKPVLELLYKDNVELKESIDDYYSKLDENLEVIYFYRKSYDDSIKLINENMSSMLDDAQEEAQKMYPHFFERFKTDGVEHNMYIGESITRDESFSKIYLYNLRLWQIQVMCEMENAFYNNQHLYPLSLDVASMILVFNEPLSIGFRMDEKRFDVDGTYNARYEVVKKRVDKAYIKGTEERVTEKGKLSIVYSQKEDEEEYLRYVKFFQSKKLLANDAQVVEVEDLQGVTGLKAIKVSILYHEENNSESFYTYDDLMQVIKD